MAGTERQQSGRTGNKLTVLPPFVADADFAAAAAAAAAVAAAAPNPSLVAPGRT